MGQEALVTARRFVKALKKQMNVNRLILFGSRARGDNFVTSDFDFVLVSNGFNRVSIPSYPFLASRSDKMPIS